MSDTIDKEFGPAEHEKEEEKEKLISTLEEGEGMLKEYRNNVYITIYNVMSYFLCCMCCSI